MAKRNRAIRRAMACAEGKPFVPQPNPTWMNFNPNPDGEPDLRQVGAEHDGAYAQRLAYASRMFAEGRKPEHVLNPVAQPGLPLDAVK